MITILLPIYNGIEFIEQSVSSVLHQTFTEWELLIGINGHPPNSPVYKIAKTYESPKIKVFDLHTIKGKSNTLNHLIQYCEYPYIALLDVDDIWYTQKLESQSSVLGKYDVIGSRCIYFGDIDGTIPHIPIGDISNYDFYLQNPLINTSSIIKKEYCYWDGEFDGIEDYDLWMRLRYQHHCSFYNLPEVLVKHRIHDTSAFNSKGNDDKRITIVKNRR
jgi:glycosyltransferase involved in cell wall biosynthesis